MNRRALILRELGLTPVWVRRSPEAADPAAAEPAEQAGDPGAATVPVPAAASPRRRAIPAIAGPGAGGEASAAAHAATVRDMDWPELEAAVTACTACALHRQRNMAVFGVGDRKAEWLFIGEGPGAEEDARGEPFVGQAGKLLDNMLAAIGLRRGHNVYIANVVKCRPPGNRNPAPGEAQSCAPYLARQIELIRPRLIIALGKVAAQNLTGSEATIASLRGRIHNLHDTPLIVTYHPAYLLRTLADKARAWEDLCFAVETMKALKAGTLNCNSQAS